MGTKVKLKRKTRSTKNQVAQVYLYEAIGLPRYKIGWAFNAKERCERLKKAQPPVDYRILEIFDCYNAEGIEDSLHKRYEKYNVKLEHSKEWFELPPEILIEVREIYKDYQRQWEKRQKVNCHPAEHIYKVSKELLEELTRIRRGEKKETNRKKSTLQNIWSTTNLVLEVIGKTAKESAEGLVQIMVNLLIKKKGQFNTKRRGFRSSGLYYHRSQKISLDQIGAAAIAFCIAAAIIAIAL